MGERPQKVIVAALQIAPVFMNKREGIDKYCEAIREAGRQGVKIIVTPETGIPTYPYWRGSFGYTSPETAELWRDVVIDLYQQSVRIPSEDTERLGRAAKEAGAYCVIGLQEADDRQGSCTLYNTQVFIGPDGRVLGRHRKLMPTHQERIFWGRGEAEDLTVVETPYGRLGALICYENHMTLAKSALAHLGEEIHAANWPGYWTYVGESRSVKDMSGNVPAYYLCDIDSAVREYAFETQSFVISSSLYLPEESVPDSFPYKSKTNWKWACGGSSIVNPFGMYLAEPVIGREAVVMAELDLRDRIVAKNIFDCLGHYQRPDLLRLTFVGAPGPEAVTESPAVGNSGRHSVRPAPLALGAAPRTLGAGRLEQIAERHGLSLDKLEQIARDLRQAGVEID